MIPLGDNWHFRIAKIAGSGGGIGPNDYPGLLFNAMINPLIPYAIRGVLWYQGETNAGRAYQYRTAFPLMITDWRSHWGQGNFPFYFVQLASFNAENGNSEQDKAVPGLNCVKLILNPQPSRDRHVSNYRYRGIQ